MKAEEIKIGDRLFHAMFGWCKVTHPVTPTDKVLVDLEADRIMYCPGIGREEITVDKKEDFGNVLYTPIADILKSPNDANDEQLLRRIALNVKCWRRHPENASLTQFNPYKEFRNNPNHP